MRVLLFFLLLQVSLPLSVYCQKTADIVYEQVFWWDGNFNGYVPYTDIISQQVKTVSIKTSPVDTLSEQWAMIVEKAFWYDSLGMPVGCYIKGNERFLQKDSLLSLEQTSFYDYNSDALKALSILLNYLNKSDSDSLFCDSLLAVNTGSIVLKKASRDSSKAVVLIDVGEGVSVKLSIVRPYYLQKIEVYYQDIDHSTIYFNAQKQLVRTEIYQIENLCQPWSYYYYSFNSSGLLYKRTTGFGGEGRYIHYDEFSRIVSNGKNERYVYPDEKTQLPACVYYNNEWEFKLKYELRAR